MTQHFPCRHDGCWKEPIQTDRFVRLSAPVPSSCLRQTKPSVPAIIPLYWGADPRAWGGNRPTALRDARHVKSIIPDADAQPKGLASPLCRQRALNRRSIEGVTSD